MKDEARNVVIFILFLTAAGVMIKSGFTFADSTLSDKAATHYSR